MIVDLPAQAGVSPSINGNAVEQQLEERDFTFSSHVRRVPLTVLRDHGFDPRTDVAPDAELELNKEEELDVDLGLCIGGELRCRWKAIQWQARGIMYFLSLLYFILEGGDGSFMALPSRRAI